MRKKVVASILALTLCLPQGAAWAETLPSSDADESPVAAEVGQIAPEEDVASAGENGLDADSGQLSAGVEDEEVPTAPREATVEVASVGGEPRESVHVQGGVYSLVNNATGRVASIGAADNTPGSRATLMDDSCLPFQRFSLTELSDGSYVIIAIHSSQVLDVVASLQTVGTWVTQWTRTDNDNQRWKVESGKNGGLVFVSACNDLALGCDASGKLIVVSRDDPSAEWNLRSAQTVTDGEYYLATSADESLVLDVCGGSSKEGANVTLYNKTGVKWQKFRVSYLGNGYYKLVNSNSGQSLDVTAALASPGTNVTQWSYFASENQQWAIEEQETGYRIVSRCNGLELSANSQKSCSNVVVGSGSVTTWSFCDAALPRATQCVPDGIYSIANAGNTTQVLDVVAGSQENGANITLFDSTGVDWQHYRVRSAGNGYYTISAMHSNQCLDIVASSLWPGANVTQWPSTGADNQLWIITPNDDGTYSIVSKLSGMYLECVNSSRYANIRVNSPCGSDQQKWTFERQESSASIDEGVYTIGSSANPSCVLDVVAGSHDEGANVTLWNDTRATWQRFALKKASGDYYVLLNLETNRVLDVVGSGHASGTNVSQWGEWDTDNQLWRISQNDDGSYSIVSKCNGLALAVDGSSSAGVNVVVKTLDQGDSSQRWNIERCSTQESFKLYLDAGHGWGSSASGQYDSGALGVGYVEAELTSSLARRIADICRSKYGICVYENETGHYRNRHSEAVSLGCSALISIHFNSFNGAATGSESYIHSYNASKYSYLLQDIMHTYLVSAMGSDRGQREAAYAVCSGPLPAVLLEVCFIDNYFDMSRYDENRVALALAEGIYKASLRTEW